MVMTDLTLSLVLSVLAILVIGTVIENWWFSDRHQESRNVKRMAKENTRYRIQRAQSTKQHNDRYTYCPMANCRRSHRHG